MKALPVIGQVGEAVGDFTQGIAAYDAGKYTRRVMQINAQSALDQGVAQRERIRTQARMQMGQQLVDQGASGFQVGTGSALDALRESAINRELDLMTSRQNATLRANGYEQQGALAYASGYSSMVGGIISGAAKLADAAAGAANPAMAAGG